MRVIRHERIKYACPCCDGALRLAPKPAQIIPKGLFTASALAWVITAKYEDGLPLYRQAALLGRFGGADLSRNTMAASVVRVGQAVQPVINLLRDHLLDAPITFGDETRVQVLKEPGRAAQAQSFMWAQMTDGSGPAGTGPPIRLFGYSPSRGAGAAQGLYAGMRVGSVLMSDGYEVYNQIARMHQLVHLGCWAHYLECGFILSCGPATLDLRRAIRRRTRHKSARFRVTAGTRAGRPSVSTAWHARTRFRHASRRIAWLRASSSGSL